MQASKIVKQQIMIEIFALIGLFAVICYAYYAIDKNNKNRVTDTLGFVTVVDDEKLNKFIAASDGEGMSMEGLTYTITNNNQEEKSYKVVVEPSIQDEKVLKHLRICIDNLYVENLVDLERSDTGYVLLQHNLKPGYTKVHSIKIWYKLGTEEAILDSNITFDYHLGT